MFPLPIIFQPKKYISHLLIIICIIVSIFWFLRPELIDMFGFARRSDANLVHLFLQILLFQFFHGNLLHLFLNVYFLYSAWPEIEVRMKRKKYILFFITSTLFVAISLFIFSPLTLTIGISGFCMALLSYLWIDLYTLRNPASNQILVMLVINILLGLSGGISFTAHAAGAVWGVIWWYMRKKW